MIQTICVYSSSSEAIDTRYFEVARELGTYMGKNKHTLVFGAGKIGLMGEIARSVHQHGGKVIGVIPEHLNGYGITYEESDRLIITQTMRERKAIMEETAEAFIGLPGGFGTLEEILEVITLKQLQIHQKPIVLINTNNFYRHLLALFEQIYAQKFAKEMHREVYYIAEDAASALEYIENYVPRPVEKKWF